MPMQQSHNSMANAHKPVQSRLKIAENQPLCSPIHPSTQAPPSFPSVQLQLSRHTHPHQSVRSSTQSFMNGLATARLAELRQQQADLLAGVPLPADPGLPAALAARLPAPATVQQVLLAFNEALGAPGAASPACTTRVTSPATGAVTTTWNCTTIPLASPDVMGRTVIYAPNASLPQVSNSVGQSAGCDRPKARNPGACLPLKGGGCEKGSSCSVFFPTGSPLSTTTGFELVLVFATLSDSRRAMHVRQAWECRVVLAFADLCELLGWRVQRHRVWRDGSTGCSGHT
jgi:hypothetical protein